ncbi:MAG: PKD domain-containing protein [Flavobacteriales bacterium]|nr:PKD domain-containing protein [Flavobacteriales bacterium]
MFRFLPLTIALFWSTWAMGTHVLGGEMFYDKLLGNQYRVTLKLYRDCGPGNTNGTGFDAEIQLAIYDGNNVFQFSQFVGFTGENSVPVDLSNPCLAAPPTICAAWAEYITTVELPPNATGYVISYQRCCRTPTIINLPSGLLQGLTCTVQIPPSSSGNNSSPRFSDYPPVALCLGQDMTFDHSATDPDGDVLVYDLFTPYAGGTPDDPAPLAPPPPYTNILWAPGYSSGDPIDADPGLSIDPGTGVLSVHPTLAGSFAAGIRVREFRNGQLLSASIRDVRFDVVPCEVNIVSSVQDQQEFCTGLTVAPENESINGQFWHWDFGDPGMTSDTSNLAEPQWTYANEGSYTITLVANPGWPCADTSFSTYEVHPPLAPYFDRPPIRCTDESAQFVAQGSFTEAASISWDFGDNAIPVMASGPLASAAFIAAGAQAVQLTVQDFGCEESFTDSAVVYPRPALSAETDRSGCVNTPFNFAATATALTPLNYTWRFGDGSTTSGPLATHAYADPGVYDIVLTVATDEGCIDERSIVLNDWIEVFPKPVAAFTVEPDEVELMDPRIEVQDFSQLAQEWSYVIEGITYTQPSFAHEFEEAGQYAITQVVTSGNNCTSAITRIVNVTDHLFYAPNAFTPDGDGVNDTFAPSVRGARLYEIMIMDRWGTERFHSTDPKAEWTGDGLPQGIYTYKVRLAEFGAYRKEYSGYVTLLR